MNYSREEIVLASKCDMKANLSLVGAVQIIQDNVCYYFRELGIDQIYMKNKFNVVWVYTKNKIEFYKNLHWNDTFRVKCFISKITPITMVVDTVFVGENKEIFLYSKIEICLLDIEKQKIRRIKEIIPDDFETQNTLKDFTFEKFVFDEQKLSYLDNVVIKSSNIDYCMHTNNIEYIRFLTNIFSVNELIRNNIKSFEIDYINQSREGDNLNIYQDKTDDTKLIIKNGDLIVIKCKIQKEKRRTKDE